MSEPKFTVHVTPMFDGLVPKYGVLIYKMIPAGVSGPADETIVDTLDDIDGWLTNIGFTRLVDYSPVCPNGFASAPLDKVDVAPPRGIPRPIVVGHEPAFVGGK